MKQTEKVSLEARVLKAMTAIWCKCSEQAYRGGLASSVSKEEGLSRSQTALLVKKMVDEKILLREGVLKSSPTNGILTKQNPTLS